MDANLNLSNVNVCENSVVKLRSSLWNSVSAEGARFSGKICVQLPAFCTRAVRPIPTLQYWRCRMRKSIHVTEFWSSRSTFF